MVLATLQLTLTLTPSGKHASTNPNGLVGCALRFRQPFQPLLRKRVEDKCVASVASPLDVPKPTIFHVAYLNVTRISSLIGLASIVDGLKVWRGFLQEIITLYQDWVRLPLYDAFMLVWPDQWLRVPRSGVDLLIIWSAFFAAASYHVYYEDGRNIVAHIYANERNFRSWRVTAILRTIAKVVTIFIIGPVLYPLKALSHSRGRERKDHLIITRWLVMNPRAILKYVLFQFFALVLLLLFNYQFLT